MMRRRLNASARSFQRALAAALVLVAGAHWLGCGKGEEAKAPPPMDVLVTDVVQKDVPVYGEWIGTLSGLINATIRSQVTGYLLTKDYHEGDVVQENQLLFQIDPREFQAAVDQAVGNLAKAKAAQVKTQLDVNRYTPLAKQGAVSQQELDNAVQQNQANQAAVDSAEAALVQSKLNLGWTKVASPIKGVSGIAIAQIGNLVTPQTELTTVSTLDPIKVVVPVSEQEYLRFARNKAREDANNAPRAGALELILADGTVFPHRGTVTVIGRQVDPRTGTITIEGQFPNPENILRPGGYAKVRAVIDKIQNGLVIPQAAVQNFQGTNQLAVVTPENKVEIRNVTMGPRSGLDWVVSSGVNPGDRIIVEGLQKVRGGMTVAPKPWVAPVEPATPTVAPF
jgi:membrane fusion protein (multidrug efflux system)